MIHYTLGFMFDTDKKYVALMLKNRPDWQKGRYNGIGGKVEQGEHILTCMVREFREETGIVTHSSIWNNFAIITDNDSFKTHCFCCFTDDVFSVNTVTDEEVDLIHLNDIDYSQCVNALNVLIPSALAYDDYEILTLQM